jgi:hypothetical protein
LFGADFSCSLRPSLTSPPFKHVSCHWTINDPSSLLLVAADQNCQDRERKNAQEMIGERQIVSDNDDEIKEIIEC